MKIALLGMCGIPANYSGLETGVEQLDQRLVGYMREMTVYCYSHLIIYTGGEHKGIRLVKMPTIANKCLNAIVHKFVFFEEYPSVPFINIQTKPY